MKLGSVEEGAQPEARQHKTDAIGKGLVEARDVEFERGTRNRLHEGR
jgi:hypothetical protein